MRLGLRARETLVITALTCLVVVTTTVTHLAQVTRVVVEEAGRQAELIARQIYAQARRGLVRAPGGDPWAVLRRDEDLRSLVEASVGYSPHLLYVLLDDASGTAIVHSERSREGSVVAPRRPLAELVTQDPLRRGLVLYAGGTVYEVALPLRLDGRPFGGIRLGVSTSLLRRELRASLGQALAVAGLALPVAWLVAITLAHLTLRPVRQLTKQMARLRRGEMDVEGVGDLPSELGQLATELQALGRELQLNRVQDPGQSMPLQQVVDHLEDALIFCREDKQVLFFNRAAEAVVGRPLSDALGRPLDEVLGAAHPLTPLVADAFRLGTGFRNAPLAIRLEGQPREFLASAFVVRDAERTLGVMLLLKDLGSIRTLSSLVSYSTKLAALGRLTSGVAHEVKNPLNAMMIHLELVRSKLGDGPDEVRQSLDIIGEEIRRLDRVVQGFLRFLRPQELALKPVDLNALLSSVASLLEAEGQKAGVRFALALDPALSLVTGDEELLRQAFLNIVQNACQAMPEGGAVTITTTRETSQAVRVTIADEGVGIPAEDLDKIFKLYYTTKPDGSGIGLSVAYRVIQLHDGDIEVRSEVGRGTTMAVTLPARWTDA